MPLLPAPSDLPLTSQASALSAPLSAYLAKVEASPGFFSVVEEIAQATAKPDATLGSSAPSAAEFPAFAVELNAVAAQDAAVVGSLPASSQAFLAQAAKGEIAVIESVLGSDGTTSTTGSAAPGPSAAVGSSSSLTPFVRPTGAASLNGSASAGANSSAPNASHAMAPVGGYVERYGVLVG